MSAQPREVTAASVAPVFMALGDATRLALLSRLCEGQPLSITQLTEGTSLTRQGVTKHLAMLERAGIAVRQRVGRETRYSVSPEPLNAASDYLSRASRQWDEAMARLKRLVES